MRYLRTFESWSVSNLGNQECLVKNYDFSDIYKVISFIDKINKTFNEFDHHPTKLIWQGTSVQIWLNTHTTKSISEKDIQLSNQLDNIYNNL